MIWFLFVWPSDPHDPESDPFDLDMWIDLTWFKPWCDDNKAHMHVYHYPLFENGTKRGLWAIASCRKDVGNFQHQYLPELLVNVYSCCLMVKVCLAVVYVWKPAFLKSSHKCDLASKPARYICTNHIACIILY